MDESATGSVNPFSGLIVAESETSAQWEPGQPRGQDDVSGASRLSLAMAGGSLEAAGPEIGTFATP